jgi:membrane-bound serine protease (ClpP class)
VEEAKRVLAEREKNGLKHAENGLEVDVMSEIPSNVRRWSGLLFLWLLLALPYRPMAAAPAASEPVVVLTLEGAIGPASADFIARSLIKAQHSGAQLVVLEMDTPGGLDASMRDIIKDILASPIPVATYVAPSGARAASAGTYILYASHIAAMAPGTNLGAATPVEIGGGSGRAPPRSPALPGDGEKSGNRDPGIDPETTMRTKQLNDAAAYLRGLAQLRGRNADWPERAVRESVSLSAGEALQQGVIDVVANDLTNLLQQLDGRKVIAGGVERTLTTRQVTLQTLEPDWRTQLLSVITDPSVAYILLLVGIYGLFFEFYSPGMLLPGVVGAIALVTALFALHWLPINYAGLGLLLLGLAFLVAEGFVPSFGALGIGGLLAFVLGSVMLIDTDAPGYRIPWSLIAAVTVTSLLLVLAVVGTAVSARRRPIVTGQAVLLGSIGELLEETNPEGFALIRGETWRVHGCGPEPLHQGQKVRVIGVRGLLLDVVSDENSGV